MSLEYLGSIYAVSVTIYYIFFVDQFAAQNDGIVSPHALPAQRASALTPPPTASVDYRVDCCLKSPNGGHLRPGPRASLNFFVRPIPTLQSTEPATARAHRTPRACFRPIGSCGSKIYVHGGFCHGERGPKLLVGRAAPAHVGCCVLLCFLCPGSR